jgi:hypothetical protein
VGHQVASAHGTDDVPDGVQDQRGLLVLDVVAAVGCHYQPAARDQLGEFALQLLPQPLFVLDERRGRVVGVAVGEHDQRHRPQRGLAQRQAVWRSLAQISTRFDVVHSDAERRFLKRCLADLRL